MIFIKIARFQPERRRFQGGISVSTGFRHDFDKICFDSGEFLVTLCKFLKIQIIFQKNAVLDGESCLLSSNPCLISKYLSPLGCRAGTHIRFALHLAVACGSGVGLGAGVGFLLSLSWAIAWASAYVLA